MEESNCRKNNTKEKCQQYMTDYLYLDKNQLLPVKLTIHLFTCSNCRKQVKTLNHAQKIAGKTSKIKNQRYIDFPKITLPLWIITGILLILTMITAGITFDFTNSHIKMFFSILFAAAITSYCALFIGTNLDFFVKQIDTHKSKYSI